MIVIAQPSVALGQTGHLCGYADNSPLVATQERETATYTNRYITCYLGNIYVEEIQATFLDVA